MVLSARDVSRRLAARFHLPDLGRSARLAFRQVALMALLIFAMMFATQDHSMSRLFLGTFLVWCWLDARSPQRMGPREAGPVHLPEGAPPSDGLHRPAGLVREGPGMGSQQGAARESTPSACCRRSRSRKAPPRCRFPGSARPRSCRGYLGSGWWARSSCSSCRRTTLEASNVINACRDHGLPAPDPQQHRGAVHPAACPHHRGGSAFLHAPGGAPRGPAQPPDQALV